MAVTNEEVFNWFQNNPNATDAEILKVAAAYNVPLSQISQVTGLPLEQAQIRTFGVLAKPPESLTQQDLEAISMNSLGKNLYAPPPAPVAYTDPNPVFQEFGRFLGTPNVTDAQVVSEMNRLNVTPEQVASITNLPLSEITARMAAVAPKTPVTVKPVARPVASQQPVSGGMLGPLTPASTSSTAPASTVPVAQAYTPEYFNTIQNYYSGYLPNQNINTQMLSDWYGNGGNLNYGGNTYAQPVQSTPVNQPAPPVESSGGDYDQSFSSTPANTDIVNQVQNLNNPVTQGLLSALPLGIGGAVGGYTGATLANQLNEIVNLYGGELGKNVNPMLGALQGFFGLTPDTSKAAGIFSNQFDNTAQMAGYMQAATDPVLGSIVNNLVNPNTTAKDYGNIAAMVGQQINEILAANPQLSYEDAAAVTSFGFGLNTGPVTAAQDQALANSFAESLGGYSSYSAPSDNSQSYGGGDSTSSSSADSTASDNSGVGGY